jgi:PAS domain S-box-containing protein
MVHIGVSGELLGCTEAFATMIGLPDVTDRTFDDLLGPESDGAVADRLREAIAGRRMFAGELLCYRAPGIPFWSDLVVWPAEREDGVAPHVIALFRDITARHTAEAVLGASDGTRRLALDRVPAGIIVHGASTEILYANAKATEMLGISYDAVLGAIITDPRWEFVGEDGAPLALADFPVGRALTTRTVVRDLVIGARHPDSHELIWALCNAYPQIDEAGTITEVVVSFTDITSLKKTQRALQDSEERLRLVLLGTKVAPWDWDMTANTMYYSPRWWEMLGLEEGELPSDPELWVRLLHPDDAPTILALLDHWLGADNTSFEMEFRLRHKEPGRWVRVLARGHIQRDANGVPTRAAGANTDVTERRALQDRLRQSQKMEAIGQLAGGVAHDFNNLLAVIVGNLELLRSAVALSGEAEEGLADTIAAAERGADLTRRLLSFSRQQPMVASAVDLATVLRNLSVVLKRLIHPSIAVIVDVPAELPRIQLDGGLLENALLNLAINARDAMPTGGVLTLAAAMVEVDGVSDAWPSGLAAGAYVRVIVADTGVGMPPDILDRALDPFFTTKPLGSGTGLGLSMAYGFAKQSQGDLAIQSSPGAGTRVTLYLPARPAITEGSSADGALTAVPVAAPRAATVLVVEDDAAVRHLCVRALRTLGYQTIEAESGPDAIRTADRTGVIDVLLTDFAMPGGMSGRELAAVLVAKRPTLQVIFMSGYQTEIVAPLASDPSFRFLNKPFSVAKLARAVAAALA